MTIYRIGANARSRLLAEPESGMGYQVLQDRNDKAFVAFNTALAIPLDELRSQKFSAKDYSLLSGDPEKTREDLELLQLPDKLELKFSLFDQSIPDDFGLSSPESVIEPSKAAIPTGMPLSYYRFSPYNRDLRVDPITGNFAPGTYATTLADMHFVPSGFAAVGRYALPNPASACFVFHIVTNARPNLIGTATPNFGQAGGGVEVLFSGGATNQPGESFRINIG